MMVWPPTHSSVEQEISLSLSLSPSIAICQDRICTKYPHCKTQLKSFYSYSYISLQTIYKFSAHPSAKCIRLPRTICKFQSSSQAPAFLLHHISCTHQSFMVNIPDPYPEISSLSPHTVYNGFNVGTQCHKPSHTYHFGMIYSTHKNSDDSGFCLFLGLPSGNLT